MIIIETDSIILTSSAAGSPLPPYIRDNEDIPDMCTPELTGAEDANAVPNYLIVKFDTEFCLG